jgi:hypothetical protein
MGQTRRIPTGFRPKAQGCEQRATLGESARQRPTPTGLWLRAGNGGRNPVGVGAVVGQVTQGSSLLATLGWETQSLRDWGRNGGLVRSAEPPRRGTPIARACVNLERSDLPSDGIGFSLSPGERAGVRGNGALEPDLTSGLGMTFGQGPQSCMASSHSSFRAAGFARARLATHSVLGTVLPPVIRSADRNRTHY